MNSLRRLVSALRTAGAGAVADTGMSVAQQFALRVIGRHPGLTMGELSVATLTTPSTVSEVVVRLVERDLVSRTSDPQDHRRVRLRLTPSGAQAFELLEQTIPERLVSALDSLDEPSRDALAALLESWVDAAGLSTEMPRMFGESGRIAHTHTGRVRSEARSTGTTTAPHRTRP